jgi:hypothetical protein
MVMSSAPEINLDVLAEHLTAGRDQARQRIAHDSYNWRARDVAG